MRMRLSEVQWASLNSDSCLHQAKTKYRSPCTHEAPQGSPQDRAQNTHGRKSRAAEKGGALGCFAARTADCRGRRALGQFQGCTTYRCWDRAIDYFADCTTGRGGCAADCLAGGVRDRLGG